MPLRCFVTLQDHTHLGMADVEAPVPERVSEYIVNGICIFLFLIF